MHEDSAVGLAVLPTVEVDRHLDASASVSIWKLAGLSEQPDLRESGLLDVGVTEDDGGRLATKL